MALILRLQVALPLFFIADMAEIWQRAGIDAVVTGAQQTDDGTAPDGFDLLFFEEQVAPDAVFDIEAAAGDGNMDVRVLIELAAGGVQRTEDADLDAQFAHVPEHGAGAAGEHALDGEFSPVAELVTILLKEAFPALIVLEQELCGSRYVHETQYKMRG